MWLGYVVLFAASFFLSAALTGAMVRISPRIGFVDRPGARKVHLNPTPLGGGVAIILSVAIMIGALVLAALLLRGHPAAAWVDVRVPDYLGGVRLVLPRLIAVGVGAVALAVMGLVDDKRGLSAWKKLAVQVAVGLLLAASGLRVSLFLPWEPAAWAVTIAWLVFVMNAFNLLDNMDGLSSGVAFIISAVFFVVALETGHVFSAVVLAIFAASVLGFLVYNFSPARIFMGDTGSYFLGYFLGVKAVAFTFVPEGASGASLLPVVLPFILFAIPFYDTLSVIFIRVREGRHPFDADKRHFSHRLSDLGLSTRETVLAVYAATLTTAFPALYLYDLGTYASMGAVVQATLVLLVIATLEHAGARKKK